MPARLDAIDDDHHILIDRPIVLIGRHEECDIQLESSKVSRKHCCIAQIDDYLVVRDLDSTNGIRINNQPVQEGKLQSGDELMIGNIRYRVTWDNDPLAGTSRPHESGAAASNGPSPHGNMLSCELPVPIREPKERPALGAKEFKTVRPPEEEPPATPPKNGNPPLTHH
jgi:predicted component of type VI protein secretion system